jgi:hypothetical protein
MAHTKACRLTAPDQPAKFATQPSRTDPLLSREKPGPPPGYTIMPDVRLDYQRES